LGFWVGLWKRDREKVCVCSRERYTECFIDLGKLNLFKISHPWSKSVKLTVDRERKSVSVCVCVCIRQRKRESQRESVCVLKMD
jgi:hypothetical protein